MSTGYCLEGAGQPAAGSTGVTLLRDKGLLAQVFCYKGSAAHEEMRGACFDYLRLGGWYSAGDGAHLLRSCDGDIQLPICRGLP